MNVGKALISVEHLRQI